MKNISIVLGIVGLLLLSCNKVTQNSEESLYFPNSVEIASTEIVQNDLSLKIHYKIYSKASGDAYLTFQISRLFIGVNSLIHEGFNNSLKIDSYAIGAYQQLLYHDTFIGKPTEFPVFIKKVKLPANKTFEEIIDINLPNDVDKGSLEGLFTIFRESEDIENYRKFKLLDMSNDPLFEENDSIKNRHRIIFKNYCQHFPDSSFFSYAISDDRFLFRHPHNKDTMAIAKESFLIDIDK